MSSIHTVAQKLASEIPAAQLVVMHDAAHVPNMERPEEVSASLGSLDES